MLSADAEKRDNTSFSENTPEAPVLQIKAAKEAKEMEIRIEHTEWTHTDLTKCDLNRIHT